MTARVFKQRLDDLQVKGHELISVPTNLVDAIWLNKPTDNKNVLTPLPVAFSGKIS